MSLGQQFKDLFSSQASEYSRFRPRYPEALFSYLAGLCPTREQAWDCGTGNGQAAVALSPHFERVIGSDPSEKQLSQAERRANIDYRLGTAENGVGLEPHRTDLVCVAQALHWFDLDRFYAEVRRVLKPEGRLAVWTYGLARIAPPIDEIVDNYCYGIIEAYWEPERKLVDEGYRSIPFPFEEEKNPQFSMHLEWTLGHLLGFLGTWSATQAAIRVTGKNPVEQITESLLKLWDEPQTPRKVSWDISLRVGRRPS